MKQCTIIKEIKTERKRKEEKGNKKGVAVDYGYSYNSAKLVSIVVKNSKMRYDRK